MTTLNEAKNKVRELAKKALEVVEDTSLTFAEQKKLLNGDDGKSGIEADIKKWEDEVQSLEFVEEKKAKFYQQAGVQIPDAGADKGGNEGTKSLGAQLVESLGYKSMVERGFKGNFTSGTIELKTTLTEGTAGTPGPGYSPANINPNVLPGVVDIKFRQLTIADLFSAGTTESPLIRYLVETAVTNAAASVAEGSAYPESAISFSKADETLHKLATFLPISEEMLEDWSQTQSYVDARLTLFIKLQEEAQLLSGDGTGSNLVGLLNRSGLAASVTKGTAPSAASDNSMDAVYRQITQIRTTAFMEPDAVVIDPIAWENILLSKNSQGFYYAQGPFASAENPMLWGKNVVATPAVTTSGEAIVGAFKQAAQIFRKGGITVEASNSHADYFQRGLTAIRAEERLGLAVYRPGAFGTVTGL
ncbi:MAG: phage major capsid protein [Sphingomicrobium sp.]